MPATRRPKLELMDRIFTTEQMQRRLRRLPQSLRDFIFAEWGDDLIDEIGQRFGLDDDQISDLARLITYVFSGFLRPSEMRSKARQEFGLNDALAAQLMAALDQEIFWQYRDDLEAAYNPTPEQA